MSQLQQLADHIFETKVFNFGMVIEGKEQKFPLKLTFQNKSNTYRVFRFQDKTLFVTKVNELQIEMELEFTRDQQKLDFIHNSN